MLTSEEIKQAQLEVIGSAVAANGVIGLVKRRIQNAGQTSTNQLIGGGIYSKGWAAKRKSRGRQVAHIDLTDTNQFMPSFTSGKKDNEVVTGFDDPNIRTTTTKSGKSYSASLTKVYTEAEHWTKNGAIFQLSTQEIEYYQDSFARTCQQIIAKRMTEALKR